MAKLLTIKEAGKELSVSPDTLRRLIKTSRIAAVRVATRVLIPLAEVERIVRQGAEQTSAGPTHPFGDTRAEQRPSRRRGRGHA